MKSVKKKTGNNEVNKHNKILIIKIPKETIDKIIKVFE